MRIREGLERDLLAEAVGIMYSSHTHPSQEIDGYAVQARASLATMFSEEKRRNAYVGLRKDISYA